MAKARRLSDTDLRLAAKDLLVAYRRLQLVTGDPNLAAKCHALLMAARAALKDPKFPVGPVTRGAPVATWRPQVGEWRTSPGAPPAFERLGGTDRARVHMAAGWVRTGIGYLAEHCTLYGSGLALLHELYSHLATIKQPLPLRPDRRPWTCWNPDSWEWADEPPAPETATTRRAASE